MLADQTFSACFDRRPVGSLTQREAALPPVYRSVSLAATTLVLSWLRMPLRLIPTLSLPDAFVLRPRRRCPWIFTLNP